MITLLCTPIYRSTASACHPQMLATKETLKGLGLVRPEWLHCIGPEVRGNRNKIVRSALQQMGQWDALLWIDGDTSCTAAVVEQMIDADKDILGAGYKMRGKPHVFAAVRDGQHVSSEFRGLRRVDWAGAGLLLVKRTVFERLQQPWFRNLFDRRIDPYDQTPEDVGFCLYAGQCGIETWLLGVDGVEHYNMTGAEVTA